MIVEAVAVLVLTALVVVRVEMLRRDLPVEPYVRPAAAWCWRRMRAAGRICARIARTTWPAVTRIAIRESRNEAAHPHWAETAGYRVTLSHRPDYRGGHRLAR